MSICPCSKRHSPPITEAETDLHHSPPKSWALRDPMGGKDARQVVRLCAQAHRLEHSILNLFAQHEGAPPKAALHRFPPVLVDLGRSPPTCSRSPLTGCERTFSASSTSGWG